MKTLMVSLNPATLKQSPWRFSENYALAHQATRYYSSILGNIALSLQSDLQIAPIHVRPLTPETFEILDGHIVVDAARQIGMESLLAIVHEGLTEDQARLRYIHLNLNRCGQYGHYHVKIHRVFGQVLPGETAEHRADLIHSHTSWPKSRVLDYVELSERDVNWEKFMYVPKAVTGTGEMSFDDDAPTPVPDHQ